MEESRTLAKERRIKVEAWREKSEIYSEERSVRGTRGRASKEPT